ncbi:hypothetical protein H5410_027593 [Solanum commersonii]|uniref:Uncharacterized protein n=1 Tax=Solanum commersonii TaxID=4109 RepID=A0A9J5Z1P2_SOLCO|nr:hypothetical protein H5410_027593 [Solanum commersonii]
MASSPAVMARMSPVSPPRLSDQSQLERLDLRNKTHKQLPTTSSSNSVINIMSSKRELDGTRKNISLDCNEVIHGMLIRRDESPNKVLQHTTKSANSIIPIVRSEELNSAQIATELPGRRLQIQAFSQQIRGDLLESPVTKILAVEKR